MSATKALVVAAVRSTSRNHASPKIIIHNLGDTEENSANIVEGAMTVDSGEDHDTSYTFRNKPAVSKSPLPIAENMERNSDGEKDVGNDLVEAYVSNLLLCCENLQSPNETRTVDNGTEEDKGKINIDKKTAELLLNIPESYLQLLNDNSMDLDLPVKATTNSTICNDKTKETIPEGSNSSPASSSQTENITNSDAPMSVCISSMFARKKRVVSNEENTKVMRAVASVENPELLRVRIAESLLMLSEFDGNSKFCVSCKKPVAGTCKLHGNPLSRLKQTSAVISLPTTMTVEESSLPNAGLGVFSLAVFEVGSLFGPMEGEKLTFEENKQRSNNAYVWEVFRNDRATVSHYLDCIDEGKSNWMRFVNCARFEEEQNLIAEQYDGMVFYKAYKKILPGDELLVWYGNGYSVEVKPSIAASPVKRESDTKDPSEGIQHTPDGSGHSVEESKLKTEKFQCLLCNAMFTSQHYLDRHRNFVCPVSSEFRCDVCSRPFKNMLNYKRHKTRGCKGEKTFNCIICSAAFTQKANLKVHLKTHMNIRDFKCQQCEKTFSRATFLRNHVLAVHEKQKPYICNVCHKSFARMDSLKRHMTLHSERNTKCAACGKSFPSSSALKSHQKNVHLKNGDKLEDTCRLCFQKFPDIKYHMLNVHEKKAISECHICKQSFRNLSNHLKMHKRQEEEKKQTCPICKKQFVTLNGHMKKHKDEVKTSHPTVKIKQE